MPHKEALAAQVIGLREAGCELSGRHVLLVGASGAGRAVAFAVAGAGAAGLTIANRTAARAERLASDVAAGFPVMAVAAGPPDPAGHDVVVNATGVRRAPVVAVSGGEAGAHGYRDEDKPQRSGWTGASG